MSRAEANLQRARHQQAQDREGDRKWLLCLLLGSVAGVPLEKLVRRMPERWNRGYLESLLQELLESNRAHLDGDRWLAGPGATPYKAPAPVVKLSPPKGKPLPDVPRPPPLPPRSGIPAARPVVAAETAEDPRPVRVVTEPDPSQAPLCSPSGPSDEAALYPSQSAPVAPSMEEDPNGVRGAGAAAERGDSGEPEGGAAEPQHASVEPTVADAGRQGSEQAAGHGLPAQDGGGHVPVPQLPADGGVVEGQPATEGLAPAQEPPGAWVLRHLAQLELSDAEFLHHVVKGSDGQARRLRRELQERLVLWRKHPERGFGRWQSLLETVLGPYGADSAGTTLTPSGSGALSPGPARCLDELSEREGADGGRAAVSASEEGQPAGASAGGEALDSAGPSCPGPSGDRQPENGSVPLPPVSSPPCPPPRLPISEVPALAPEAAPETGRNAEGAGSGRESASGFVELQRLVHTLQGAGDLLQVAQEIVAGWGQRRAQDEAQQARIVQLEQQVAELEVREQALLQRCTEAETERDRLREGLRRLVEGT